MHSSAFVAESISIFQMAQYRLNHLLYMLRMFQIPSNSFKLILISSFLFKHLEPYNIDMYITKVLTMCLLNLHINSLHCLVYVFNGV